MQSAKNQIIIMLVVVVCCLFSICYINKQVTNDLYKQLENKRVESLQWEQRAMNLQARIESCYRQYNGLNTITYK